MSKDVMVYFNSGNKARFSLDKVRFIDQHPGQEAFDDGCTVVNWNNVSFVREYREPKEEEDE